MLSLTNKKLHDCVAREDIWDFYLHRIVSHSLGYENRNIKPSLDQEGSRYVLLEATKQRLESLLSSPLQLSSFPSLSSSSSTTDFFLIGSAFSSGREVVVRALLREKPDR